MFERARQGWRALKRSEPGERFQDRYHRYQSQRAGRPGPAVVVRMVGGVGMALLGFMMLFTPGPGLVFLAAGGALLGSESRRVARGLDRLEILVRQAAARFSAWRS
ncbi:hypothetical protein [Denitromonas iodatirespirans]|uniref:TIGR02611 family protein n=1 Tax=Denitromonas iodatirespirans TaxID=2795389 RepID=A0A944D896_DENI1|nr:hypothetical protein [Denitromonas iodatirespirans]MBT0959848.1 hypothetical protein [Denitromonas iodatirespirans]